MGDQNQAGIQHNSVQTVTSVGNSWIICRSKSHAGRIYYFNTLSGEAAWNLSDQEIEKAKTRTKFLECQSGGKFEGCPEPKDPPIDNNCNTKSPQTTQVFIPSRVYNKQIINNQFSKQTLPPVVASQCVKCSSETNFDPHSFPGPHNCNPNVWTIPPHHQIVIAPTTSPILNQLQTTVNVPCNNVEQRVSVQNTSLPLTHRFNQMQTKTPNRNFRFTNKVNKFTPRNNKNSFCQKNTSTPYYKQFNTFTGSIDLRQKLTARRKSNNAWNNLNNISDYQGEEVGTSDTQRIQIIKPTNEDITPCDADDHWLKKHASFRGTQLFLNVTPLKQLVNAGANSTWYIVADTGILLNHINLMNVLANSDENCQLMVPDFVMAALQTKSRANDSQLLSRAHHVLQILSRQFTAGNAVMGKDPNSASSIFDFCYKLMTQDHDVVLISNDVQWKSYKMNSIITLNVEELKDMLSIVVKPVERLVDDCNIQITIPNHTIIGENNDISDSKTISVGIQLENNENELSTTHTNSKNNSIMKKEILPTSKRTVDVGIQTDLNLYQDSSPTKVNSLGVNTEPCHNGHVNEKNKEQFSSRAIADSGEIPKRKEIRLKRNLSHQPATDNNVERKQFKWRRKRNASVPYATDQNTTSYNSNTFNVEGRSIGNQPSLELNRLDNILVPESRSSCYDPLDSSETSSSCFIQKSLDDKVVIEETSTSGIISNSADSESMHSIKNNEEMCNKMNYEEKDVCKCVMFEVESPVMEEYLKMRSDEWVSRFVQIMEEVLTQILQQAPAFFNRTLPPPWTIHEATECIKKKFENDSDVKDAANRLTNVLFKISDERGKISMNLEPSEFMEMYSYGVYLVDALQSVLSQCEDLQTAADSLAKLLSDIQDPTLETSHTDAFMDNTHLHSANVTDISISKTQNDIARDISKPDAKALPDLKSPSSTRSSNTEGRKYNLRSSQKKPIQDEETSEQPVKFIRKIDIESTFFSSLHLKKNQNSAEDTNLIAANNATCLNSSSNSEQNKIPQTENNAETQNNTEPQNVKPSNEPKIVRNFSKCLEFEEKIKNKQKETMEIDTLNYSQMNDDDDDDGYDYYDDYSHCEYDYYENEEEINGMDTYEDNKENESHLIDNTTVDKHGNTCFESIVRRLVKEIQEAFLEVHSFCAKVIEELNVTKHLNATISPPRKLEIKEKAEAARLIIDNLSKSLNGILSREGGNFEHKIQNILNEAGIHLDDNKSMEYRNIFGQYPIQANILLDAVNIVIEAVE